MLRSFVVGLRAARRVGQAERCEQRGDLEGSLRACAGTLELLSAPGIDVAKHPVCASAAYTALAGYCRLARQLGHQAEALAMLVRWRPLLQEWGKEPPDVWREGLAWMEEYYQFLREKLGPPLAS